MDEWGGRTNRYRLHFPTSRPRRRLRSDCRFPEGPRLEFRARRSPTDCDIASAANADVRPIGCDLAGAGVLRKVRRQERVHGQGRRASRMDDRPSAFRPRADPIEDRAGRTFLGVGYGRRTVRYARRHSQGGQLFYGDRETAKSLLAPWTGTGTGKPYPHKQHQARRRRWPAGLLGLDVHCAGSRRALGKCLSARDRSRTWLGR